MRPLGHVSQGARRLAFRVRTTVKDHGQVAVFLSRTTGQGAAVAYTDPEYAFAMRRHVQHLVGVYVDDLGDNDELFERVVEDLREHLKADPRLPVTMKDRLLRELAKGPATADALARTLGITGIYVRRLMAELRHEGRVTIADTQRGQRGQAVNVWSVAA